MKRLTVFGAALVAAALLGCNQSERGGKTSDSTRSSETFRVKAPATSTTIKQGDRKTVKLTVDRGKNFKEDVTLKASAPTGVIVDLDPKTVKASDNETVTATITVAKDAPVGEEDVKVTATPTAGNAASVDFKVKVEKRAD
jgi:uncharacterized membrane protein